jgi:hypothetical protein
MELLENAYSNMHMYTKHADGWRPGLVDLATYMVLINLHEDDGSDEPAEFIWNDTPDHIMQHLIENRGPFDLEYGMDDLYEAVREYLITNDFITHCDDVEEEE